MKMKMMMLLMEECGCSCGKFVWFCAEEIPVSESPTRCEYPQHTRNCGTPHAKNSKTRIYSERPKGRARSCVCCGRGVGDLTQGYVCLLGSRCVEFGHVGVNSTLPSSSWEGEQAGNRLR